MTPPFEITSSAAGLLSQRDARTLRLDAGDPEAKREELRRYFHATFDQPLPAGTMAYRSRDLGWPTAGSVASGWAGAPGFAFGKVLVDSAGNRGVLHHKAVDIASDNRLLRNVPWTSSHQFQSPCPAPTVTATLVHRAYPVELASERGWTLTDTVLKEEVQ